MSIQEQIGYERATGAILGFARGTLRAAPVRSGMLDAYGIIRVSREHRSGQRFIVGDAP